MAQLSHLLSDAASVARRHIAVTSTILLSLLATVAILTLPHRFTDLLIVGGVASTFMVPVMCSLAWHEGLLKSRMASSCTVWRVSINGVAVGQLKDQDYAAIRLSVLFDSRLYLAQLGNLAGVVLRVFDNVYKATPLAAFWLAVWCFFFSTTTFTEVATAIRAITPEQAEAAIPTVMRLLIAASILAVLVNAALGRRFGFVNRFDEALGDRVRYAVGCAADGVIDLSR